MMRDGTCEAALSFSVVTFSLSVVDAPPGVLYFEYVKGPATYVDGVSLPDTDILVDVGYS